MSRTVKEIFTEQFLTCCICLEEFQDPKVLTCLHTFCKECIVAIFEDQDRRSLLQRSCPICRDLPTNETFEGLYRAQVNFNLDMSRIIAIAEKNQSKYLRASVDDLRFEVIQLREQINQCQTDLENERAITARLSANLDTRDKTIAIMEKVNYDLSKACSSLKAQLDEKHDLSKSSYIIQVALKCAAGIEYVGKSFSWVFQAMIGWPNSKTTRKALKNKQ